MRARFPLAASAARRGRLGRTLSFAGSTLALLLFGSRVASTEPIGSHFELTQFGGYTLFDNRNTLTGTPLKDALNIGMRFGYHWPTWIGIEGAAGFTPAQEDIPDGQDLDFWQVSGDALVRPWRAKWGWPYLLVGGAVSQLKTSGGDHKDNQGNAEAGAGVQFWLNDAIGVRLEARDLILTPRNDPTNLPSQDWILGGGLTFAIGAKPRDTDGDGVPDRADSCANTPAGARVDDKGCPLDSDGDKVFDGIDQCPGTPHGALVDARGCPTDADGDSVFDGIDQCPDTPRGAKVDAKGCPIDSDGDGVFDGLDRCPGTPKGAVVDSVGCPIDSDGDGVPDGIDRCPDTPKNLRADSTGCPVEVIERETELLDTGMIRLQDVQFETGKAELKPEAMTQLDIVGAVLVKWPELKIEIGGHTDSRGSAAANQKLSVQRVRAVLDYLLSKFPSLRSEQYTLKGYGESKPIVPNVSPEAMALNRRVEFVVLNKDVLKRETERRRLLEKSESGK